MTFGKFLVGVESIEPGRGVKEAEGGLALAEDELEMRRADLILSCFLSTQLSFAVLL